MIKGMTRVIGALCAASACQGVLSTCGRDAPPAAKVVPRSKGSLDVVVTVPPLKGLVQPLLPEGSSVTVLMKPGRSEHGYELSPDDIVRVAKSDVFVYIGAGLEAHIEGVLSKRAADAHHEVVCFADVVGDAKLQAVQGSECTEHDKEDSGHHDDEQHSPDPHLWLDPVLAQDLVRSAAQHVEVALKARGGWTEDEAMSMAARKDALLARVAAMDHEYRERLIDAKGKPIVTHHDAFARLAKRYDLRVAAVVRIGSSSESSPGDIAKVMSAVKESGARAIFREPQSNASGAERIAQLAGVKLLVLDPLGDGDWFTMMRANLDALCEGLGEEKSGVADQDAERK